MPHTAGTAIGSPARRVDFADVLRRRRMVRAFRPDPIPADTLDRVLGAARRAPAAGNADGIDLVVLEGPEATGRYWDITLPSTDGRERFAYPRLLVAPVLAIVVADADAYVQRYAEPDKAASGLGASLDEWPVPYWTVDASFSAMLVLLAATNEGLGALFFGLFHYEETVLHALGVPHGKRAIGTIALGWPDTDADEAHPGRSAARAKRPADETVHRGHW